MAVEPTTRAHGTVGVLQADFRLIDTQHEGLQIADLVLNVSGTSMMFSSSVSICPCLLYERSRVTFSWNLRSIGGK